MSPVDPARSHEVGLAISWHGRLMVLAWGVIAPLAVLAARFFKIMPGQNWPQELDNQFWWRSHWMGQACVALLTVAAIGFVAPLALKTDRVHHLFGYLVLVGLLVQVLLGVFRGSKGGPTSPAPDGSLHGHHYDMTPWRGLFEGLHKSIGYLTLALAAAAILLGMWDANAPNWMWLALGLWWSVLIVASLRLQSRGFAVDTYQAIWGDDPAHPGNQRPHPGWGVRRPGETKKGENRDVRSA